MATKTDGWKIVGGPGKFDFIVAYTEGTPVLLTVKRSGRRDCMNAWLDGAVPDRFSGFERWIVWGNFEWLKSLLGPAESGPPHFFYGEYKFGANKGMIREISPRQHEVLFPELSRV